MATPTITHRFINPHAQGLDATRVYGPQWNDTHIVTGLENVPNVDTTNASNLTSGTVPAAQMPALTGDITTSAGAVSTTLATVNANVGTFGSATQSVQFTANGKGLLTAAANVTITPAIGSVTGLGTSVATFLATPSSANLRAALTDEVGTGAAYFVGGALGTPASGTLTSCTAFTLTTTGTSGAATYSSGTLNIPQYSGGGSGTVTSVATSGLATGGTFTTSGTVTVTAAVQSDQETGSSNTVAVTPGVQKYHPSAAKVWAVWSGAATGAASASYNVSGNVVRNSAGNYTITFATAFSSANYTCIVGGTYASGSLAIPLVVSQTTTTVTVLFRKYDDSQSLDPTLGHVVCYGDQ